MSALCCRDHVVRRVAWRRIAGAKDEQAPPVRKHNAARSPGTVPPRLTSSVEIVRARGPDAAHLAEVQLEAIREVLAWALSLRHEHQNEVDRAA